MSTVTADRPATYREVFAVREFRPLFGTMLLSTLGDELARVALAVLVYERTDSPLLSALTYGISYLPWLLGGPLLSTLADRLPRKQVMVVSDVARAVLIGLIAVPGLPLWALLALLFLVSLAAPPFESARSAAVADVLEGDSYAVGNSLQNVVRQLATVTGFALGGVLAAVDPTSALVVDALTFVVSAVWLSAGLGSRPAPTAATDTGRSVLGDMTDGLRMVARTARLRTIVGLLWAGSAFVYGPEGVFTPLADELGRGAVAAGLLFAAGPLGTVVGGVVVGRFVGPSRRERSVPLLVTLSLVPLLLAGLVSAVAGPGTAAYVAVLLLVFVSGVGSSWLIPLNQAFVQAVPSAYRGRAFGVAVTGLNGVQGIAVLAAGLVAQGSSAATVVAICGGLGLVAVAWPLAGYVRTRPHVAAARAAAGPSTA